MLSPPATCKLMMFTQTRQLVILIKSQLPTKTPRPVAKPVGSKLIYQMWPVSFIIVAIMCLQIYYTY